jgi:hypothetical protein
MEAAMIRIYKPSFEEFVAEARDVRSDRPVVYIQTRSESETDERKQPDGSLLITPVSHVSILVSAWNREDRIIAWQMTRGRVYYRQKGANDAMAIGERYRHILNGARVVEERVRLVLMDHFDVRAGVVNDTPIYCASPGWLEDSL